MSLKKGISLFLILSILVSGTLIFFSVDKSSLTTLATASKPATLLAALLVVLVWVFDALKFKFLTRAAGSKIGYGLSLELTWINYFGAAITPMQSGGGPFQMYILYKNGVSVGTSVAITLVRTFLTMLLLGLAIPFSLIIQPELPQGGWLVKGFVFYVIAFTLVVWSCVVLSIIRPTLVKKLCWIVITFLKRWGFLSGARMTRIFRKVTNEIDSYNRNVRAFVTTGRKYFVLGALAAFFQMLAQLSVMPCMIWAMGFDVAYVECVLIQALFLFLLYFIPTPGGSGAAEGGAAFVFSIFVPWSMAGVLGVAWRLLTEYTGIALGAIVAMKLLGWNMAEQIFEREEKESDVVGGP